MTDRDDKRPRAVAPLRRKLGFRQAKARSETKTHNGSTAGDPDIGASYPASIRAAKADNPAPQAQQAPHRIDAEASLGIQLPDGDPQVGRPGEQFDDGQSWTAEIAASLDGPRGPDYASFDPVLSGLVGQAEGYRTQWRNKHQKDPDAPLAVASQETKELYERCGRRLAAKYVRTEASGMAFEDVDPRDFANWLLARKPFWDDSTWRMNRAGAIAVIHTIPSSHITEALAWLYSDLQPGSGSRERESANQIEQHQIEKLKTALGDQNSKPARWLEIWLDAGISTGLHPTEWPLATLEIRHDASAPHGRRVWLHVIMGHVEEEWLTHRTLEISKFSEAAVTNIQHMIYNASEWAVEGKLAERQGQIARLLRVTSKKCGFKLQYDLHSLRQQFIENMRSEYGDAGVAALVGHLCINNERKHYTKRRAAWKEIGVVVPWPSRPLVARMQKRLEMYRRMQTLVADKAAYRLAVLERLGEPLAE